MVPPDEELLKELLQQDLSIHQKTVVGSETRLEWLNLFWMGL